MPGIGVGCDTFNCMSSMFPVLFFVAFAAILCVILVIAVKGIGQWHKNNNSPRLSVSAKVVSKRTEFHQHVGTEPHMTSSSTWYHVTFEFQSGDRQEFSVSGTQYGLLAEGDSGTLSFQGTRFLDFQRRGT